MGGPCFNRIYGSVAPVASGAFAYYRASLERCTSVHCCLSIRSHSFRLCLVKGFTIFISPFHFRKKKLQLYQINVVTGIILSQISTKRRHHKEWYVSRRCYIERGMKSGQRSTTLESSKPGVAGTRPMRVHRPT